MSQDHPILAGDHTSRWMGITVDHVEYGRAEIRMTLREEMLNGFGIAHGGMVFAFADTCFALACNDPQGDGSTITVASGVDINFIASARRGDVLTAVGTVRAQAGRSGVYDIQVMAGGRLIAEFRGRSRTVPNPDHREAGPSVQEPAVPAADPSEQEPVLQSTQPSQPEEA
ncbi:hydroxyphenylacetyl-CoA thioesterase PaaI [Kocuria sp. M1R5S2]|uniref:hydroxyphenylacetyl-CoA thioesterase PaaI n=1 Tax=Kocuria rhizosphaerae TaxID=3376285 RepID=UPI0037A95CC7